MDCRKFFITGHSEYDRDTLAKEYYRDKGKGLDIETPYNYFPNDDEKLVPKMTWKGTANLLFNNCEHFANACTLGIYRSPQVEEFFNLVVSITE